MRTITFVFLLTLVTRLSAATWTVSLEEDRRLGTLMVFTSPQITLKLTEKQFWTISSLTFGGQELVGPTGANGAVCHVTGPDGEKLDDPWIGTGHGKEKVKSFIVAIDGDPVEIGPGRTVSGDEIVVTKESNIGPLDQVAVITLPRSGERVLERATFTAVEDLATRFRYVYGWMHSTGNGLAQYLVWRTPTTIEAGETKADDHKFHLGGNMRALAQFDPETGNGIAYVYGDTYAASKHLGTRIWDRKHDNKVYFTPDFSAATLPLGSAKTYELTVLPFTAPPEAWRPAAEKLVAHTIATMAQE